jgi:hypothetical protein
MSTLGDAAGGNPIIKFKVGNPRGTYELRCILGSKRFVENCLLGELIEVYDGERQVRDKTCSCVGTLDAR